MSKIRGIKNFTTTTVPGPAAIEMKVGLFHPDWTATEPALASVQNKLAGMRRAVESVADAARQIAALPPEQRALNLDRLAKAGLNAMKAVDPGAAHDLLSGIGADYASRIRKTLKIIPGPAQEQFAASQVRDYLRGLSPRERSKALAEALDDIETTRAILGAPGMASGLDRDAYDLFERRAIDRHLPDVAAGTRVLLLAEEAVGRSHRNAVALISETAGLRQTRDGSGWKPVWQIDDVDDAA